jgi:peptide subunit release factor 1 (eRF1)
VHKAVESGVEVEVVKDSELLEEVGGIGAVLRY